MNGVGQWVGRTVGQQAQRDDYPSESPTDRLAV